MYGCFMPYLVVLTDVNRIIFRMFFERCNPLLLTIKTNTFNNHVRFDCERNALKFTRREQAMQCNAMTFKHGGCVLTDEILLQSKLSVKY